MASGEPLPVFQVRELLVRENLLGVRMETLVAILARPASDPPFRLESSDTTQAIRRHVLLTSSELFSSELAPVYLRPRVHKCVASPQVANCWDFHA